MPRVLQSKRNLTELIELMVSEVSYVYIYTGNNNVTLERSIVIWNNSKIYN